LLVVLAEEANAHVVVIAASQLANALGIPRKPLTGLPVVDFANVTQQLSQTKLAATMIAVSSYAVLWLANRLKRTAHKFVKLALDLTILVVMIASTGIAYAIVNAGVVPQSDIPLVGVVPAGIPPPTLPNFAVVDAELFINAAIIALIGFVDAWGQVTSIARDKGYGLTIDANQELWALGIANLVASVFLALPSMAAAARTSVNVKLEANTLLSAIVSSFVVLFALLLLSGPMALVPKATLAGLVIYASLGLLKLDAFKEAWTVSPKNEFVAMILTFACTVITGPKWGMLGGIVATFFVVVYNLAYPVMTELGIMRDGLFRSLHRYEEAKMIPGVALLRVDAPLFFANAEAVANKCLQIVRSDVNAIIIDASGIATCVWPGSRARAYS